MHQCLFKETGTKTFKKEVSAKGLKKVAQSEGKKPPSKWKKTSLKKAKNGVIFIFTHHLQPRSVKDSIKRFIFLKSIVPLLNFFNHESKSDYFVFEHARR
jgi:hypothetical protein